MRSSFTRTFDHMRPLWLALFAVLAACGGTTDRSTAKNLVLIVLDTTRPEFLSVYGHDQPTSPNLEAFAKEGTRFDRAYSVSSWTLPAHASMFTGVDPDRHGATQQHLTYDADIPLLAERLTDAGYDTFGVSNNPWVAQKSGLSRGFSGFVDAWRRKGKKRLKKGHRTVRATRNWLQKDWDRDKPFFVFINLIEPHMPYEPPWKNAEAFVADKATWKADRTRYFDTARGLAVRHYGGEEPVTEEEWAAVRALYAGELHHVDAITQELLTTIDAHSAPENTTVIITSDHGENIGDHGHVGHVFSVYDTTLRAVMLARGPGFKPGVRDDLVSVADVYPTLLGAAGVDIPATTTGRDLREEPTNDRVLRASYGRPGQAFRAFPKRMRQSELKAHRRSFRAAIGSRYKVIRSSNGVTEWFDLQNDPHERQPLDPSTVPEATRERLEAELKPAPNAPAVPPDDESSEISELEPEDEGDAETTEALRALGYVE